MSLSTKQKINKLEDKSCELGEFAEEILIQLVQEALRDNPHLDYFQMGMGIWGFTRVDTQYMTDDEEHKAAPHVDDFICEWDTPLCITGVAMRITRTEVKRF